MKKLVLIDSNALVHRAFHALPPLNAPDGSPSNAVYGFLSILLKMIAELKPDYIAAAFDLPGPTFRHEEYKEYKATRQRAPDELYAQIPPIKELIRAMGIPIYELAGYEADDIIGTIAHATGTRKDLQTVIVTGDMDTLQLVRDDRVVVFTLRKGMSDTVIYDQDGVRKRYDLTPDQIKDFKGLKGDPSDNIPGVKGIGDKTATALLQEFGSIEKLYQTLENPKKKTSLTERMRAKLLEEKESALFSKKLATIALDVPIKFDLQATDWETHLDVGAMTAFCTKWGFTTLIKRLPTGQTAIPLVTRPRYTVRNQELIGHDLKVLIKSDSNLPPYKRFFDTEIAAWLINPGLRAYPEPLDDARDELEQELRKLGLWNIFTEMEMPLIPILAAMERQGILINKQRLEDLAVEASHEIAKLERAIYKHAGDEFNINSPSQLGEILFTKLGIRGKVRRTGGGAPSTAAPELEKLRGEHPIIDLVLQYRELAKLKTTYIDPFPQLIAPDGRIHTTYRQVGTATGRVSSLDPNLQNIPTRTELGTRFRSAFVAAPGWQLVSLDYSQLELRVVAHVAHDKTMIEAFRRGDDIHTLTASEIFGLAPGQITKDMRRQAKVLNFGIIYGMGVLGFARAAGVPRDTAQKFVDEYFKRFSGVAAYMERTKEEAFAQGWTATIFGRRRPLPDISSTMPQLQAAAERMAINHPIQGTGADLVKLAMIAIDRYIQKEKLGDRIRLLLQVHDELVFEVRDDAIAEATRTLPPLMEQVHKLEVPLVVDTKVGPTWASMEHQHHA